MKRILIVSSSFPYYGGQSTTAYNLHKLLTANGYECRIVFILNSSQGDIDPENTGNVSSVILGNNITNKIKKILFRKSPSNLSKGVQNTSRKAFQIFIIIPKIIKLLILKRFYPNLVICNVPFYFSILKFLPFKKSYVIGSIFELHKYAASNKDAHYFISSFNKNIPSSFIPFLSYNLNRVLFNSPLTASIMGIIENKNYLNNVQYFNIQYLKIEKPSEFHNRNYSIGFISSDSNRVVKNTDLAFDIFKSFETLEKYATGLNMSSFNNLLNTNLLGLITQVSIFKILSQTKLIIVTSYFDSSPSVVSEAIVNGANVLVSKNVGWNEYLPKECVVENYFDKEEWINKANWLLKNHADYKEYLQLINGAEQQILGWVENQLLY